MECFHFSDKQMKDSSLISRQKQNIVIDTECVKINLKKMKTNTNLEILSLDTNLRLYLALFLDAWCQHDKNSHLSI